MCCMGQKKQRMQKLVGRMLWGLGVLLLCGMVQESHAGPAGSAKITRAAQERLQAAQAAFKAVLLAFRTGGGTVEQSYTWSRRVLASRLAWLKAASKYTPGTDRRTYIAHYTRMLQIQRLVQQKVKAGMMSKDAEAAANYFVKEALFWLVRSEKKKYVVAP